MKQGMWILRRCIVQGRGTVLSYAPSSRKPPNQGKKVVVNYHVCEYMRAGMCVLKKKKVHGWEPKVLKFIGRIFSKK